LPRDYCSCLGKRWWWPSWEVWQQRRSRDIWKTFRRGGSINRAYWLMGNVCVWITEGEIKNGGEDCKLLFLTVL
jgi:hypothetical protein